MMTDPIADMLTRIRNANMAYHDTVEVPASNVKKAMAEILKREGFIRDFQYINDHKQGMLRIYLKYAPNKQRVINGLKRISKPGLRVYAKQDDLPKVLGGMGVAIVSTSRGLLTDREARNVGIGGEVLCYVW